MWRSFRAKVHISNIMHKQLNTTVLIIHINLSNVVFQCTYMEIFWGYSYSSEARTCNAHNNVKGNTDNPALN
jgi:uncharacterized membrane protein YozB (DUF420 family)